MKIDEALARLERAMVDDAGRLLRELVLGGEPSEVVWPDGLPAVPDDARAWLGWRRPPEDYTFLDAPTGPSQLLTVERAAELTRDLQGELPGCIALLGDTPAYVCDGRGVVSRVDWNDDGQRVAVPADVDVAGLVDQIAAGYAARRQSPLRHLRIAADPDSPWQAVSSADMLVDATVGTAIAWSVQTKWRRRAWVAVKLEERWISSMLIWQSDELDVEDACASLRRDLGEVNVMCYSTEDLRAEIEDACVAETEPHYFRRGRVRTWSQPATSHLLARLGATRDEMPLRFAPGASDAELRDLGDVPDDLRALYAFANGSEAAIYYRYRLVPIKNALETSRILCELARDQFGAAYWDARCIPFLDKGNGDCIYVDVAGVHGPAGSVIDFDHERPQHREVLFDSVAQWLEHLVEGIEHGEYEWADEGVFPAGFFEDGELSAIKRFAEIYTNGAYPWTRTLRLADAL